MRRRLRAVRHDRDARLLELGALVFELRRRERDAPALVEVAVQRVQALDEEERALVTAVAGPEVVAASVAYPDCRSCHAPLPPGARFCPACGDPVAPPAVAATEGEAAAAPAAGAPPAEPAPRRFRESRTEVPAER
jgi:hypothetical protein